MLRFIILRALFRPSCGFRYDKNSSVLPSLARVIGLPSVRREEKKIRVASYRSDCTVRALNDDARRYRSNFVADNSHGDIIGLGPINGKRSSCSSSPRISSRRILDPYPYTRTLIANSQSFVSYPFSQKRWHVFTVIR